MTDEQFARFERMIQQLHVDLAKLATKEDLRFTNARIDLLCEESRHTNTRVDDVHREVRLLAEALGATNQKLDRVDARVERIECRIETHIEPRLATLERQGAAVEPRLVAIEGKLASSSKPRPERRKPARR